METKDKRAILNKAVFDLDSKDHNEVFKVSVESLKERENTDYIFISLRFDKNKKLWKENTWYLVQSVKKLPEIGKVGIALYDFVTNQMYENVYSPDKEVLITRCSGTALQMIVSQRFHKMKVELDK